jgi:hypothetical protein
VILHASDTESKTSTIKIFSEVNLKENRRTSHMENITKAIPSISEQMCQQLAKQRTRKGKKKLSHKKLSQSVTLDTPSIPLPEGDSSLQPSPDGSFQRKVSFMGLGGPSQSGRKR